MATEAKHSRIMDPRLHTVRWIGICFGLSALMFVQGTPLLAQQIPASELPPPGTDTGLEGKYDPTNGIAQLVRGESRGRRNNIPGRSCHGVHAGG